MAVNESLNANRTISARPISEFDDSSHLLLKGPHSQPHNLSQTTLEATLHSFDSLAAKYGTGPGIPDVQIKRGVVVAEVSCITKFDLSV